MAILGSNSPSGAFFQLCSPNLSSNSWNAGSYVTPTSGMVVSSISVYCRAEHFQFWSGGYFYIGRRDANGQLYDAVAAGPTGDTNSTPHWLTTAISKTLTANITYWIGIHNASQRGYALHVAYAPDANMPFLGGYSTYWGVMDPKGLTSIYVSGDYIITGPPITISGKTPGKLEYTSWSNIKSVR